MSSFLKALKLELWMQRDYLNDNNIDTIYFGGGTPSLLTIDQLKDIMRDCYSVFNISEDAEITLEANPDDISLKYLEELLGIGFNRISIGIQSFSANDLKLMKRRHTPTQAIKAAQLAKSVGFTNISVDLIYGVPTLTFEQWQQNLLQIIDLDVQHLSAYHLTYHKNTALYNDLKSGKIQPINETLSEKQFSELTKVAKLNGFEHYEISNFAKNELYSRHNSSYWQQKEYLGLGPSAHSYNTNSRQWNVSSLTRYIENMVNGCVPFEKEQLSLNERYNDYIITSLRTKWGTDLTLVQQLFGDEFVNHIHSVANKYNQTKSITFANNKIYMAPEAWFVSDTLMTDFIV